MLLQFFRCDLDEDFTKFARSVNGRSELPVVSTVKHTITSPPYTMHALSIRFLVNDGQTCICEGRVRYDEEGCQPSQHRQHRCNISICQTRTKRRYGRLNCHYIMIVPKHMTASNIYDSVSSTGAEKQTPQQRNILSLPNHGMLGYLALTLLAFRGFLRGC